MSGKKRTVKAGVKPLDRHDLYELCAQSPARDVKVLRAILGGSSRGGRVLGEDFCGTAAVSRAWADLGSGYRAVGVDHDAATLARAVAHDRVKLVRADVMAVRAPADLIAVLNFSIAELHDRERLVSYLKHARKRLRPRGAFVCDIYGGSDAHLTGELPQRFTGPHGEKIEYSWEQRTADPFTGRVVNAMHFAVRPGGGGAKAERLRDAFVYDWRLWSVPELRDAMREAGFSATQVYARQPDAIDADGEFHVLPVEDATELGDSFSVYVAGRR
jgi:SAM-dependent methyltransferase